MNKSFPIVKLLTLLLFILAPLSAANTPDIKPSYNKVYRTDRIADSYHFLLLDKNGRYYHIHTNKTGKLTPKEIKSSSILNILKEKQSWGQAFASKGKYTTKNGKIYTKRYWDRIKVYSSKKIKYLNKSFYLQ